nr:amidase [Mycolicibacterium komanii]
MTDLCWLPARELVALMAGGDVSCREHHGLVEVSDFSHLMAHNLTGWPAVVVRCGTSDEGLPIGVQIAARPWEDATALAVAARLEAALGGWRPPPPVA